MTLRQMIRATRCYYWRVRLRLKSVDRTFLSGGWSSISRDFIAGPYSYVGPGCLIDPGVKIGAYTMLGPSVKVVGNDHEFRRPGIATIFAGRPLFRKTSIGRDVWLGANSVVMCGVTIGDGSVVAAGAVVTKDVEPLVVVAGVPAKVIGRRFESSSDDALHMGFLDSEPQEGSYCDPIGLGVAGERA